MSMYPYDGSIWWSQRRARVLVQSRGARSQRRATDDRSGRAHERPLWPALRGLDPLSESPARTRARTADVRWCDHLQPRGATEARLAQVVLR